MTYIHTQKSIIIRIIYSDGQFNWSCQHCISVVIYSWQLKLVKENQSIRTNCDDRGMLFGMVVRQKLFPF